MEEFRSAMVQVDAGDAIVLEPVTFDNRVSEAQLEKWLLASPGLAGEPLLILGSQLAGSQKTRIAWTCSRSTSEERSSFSS
jgi:hypothetical protein